VVELVEGEGVHCVGVVWEWFEGDVIRSGFVRFVLVFVDRGMGRVGRE
jgi:hypothetical protein